LLIFVKNSAKMQKIWTNWKS